MSGKGDGMIKRRRSLRKSGIRHITEIPVEERALYIEKRKQRTIEARKQQRKTHVMLAALLCLVLVCGVFIYETDKWRPATSGWKRWTTRPIPNCKETEIQTHLTLNQGSGCVWNHKEDKP